VRETGPELAAALGALWVAVTRAGGAVGFEPASAEADIRAAADHVVAEVAAGREIMLALGDAAAPTGVVFLRPGTQSTTEHRADLLRLMVHPDQQGGGLGRTLVDAAVAESRALGLETLLLSARGGTTLPDFYTRLGWTAVGVWRGSVKLAGGERRDEHWFQLHL
jgi:GNAT superfamily N-acetyltransferase